MKYYIGIDLGGTNIKAGVVSDEFEIIAKASCKTNQTGRGYLQGHGKGGS